MLMTRLLHDYSVMIVTLIFPIETKRKAPDMDTDYLFAKVKQVNQDDRTLTAVASTSNLDRHKERVLPSAFKDTIDSFLANSVILACHQHRLPSGSSPVIGSAIPEKFIIANDEIVFTMRFAETPLGEEYWQLYRQGHMKAFSIGFLAIEWADEKDENLDYIRTYTKIELLEISAVPVPSNRQALARIKGLYREDEITEVFKDILTAGLEPVAAEIERLKTHIEDSLEEIKTLLTPDQDGLGRSLLGDPRNQFDPAGDLKTAERIRTQLQEINNL